MLRQSHAVPLKSRSNQQGMSKGEATDGCALRTERRSGAKPCGQYARYVHRVLRQIMSKAPLKITIILR